MKHYWYLEVEERVGLIYFFIELNVSELQKNT